MCFSLGYHFFSTTECHHATRTEPGCWFPVASTVTPSEAYIAHPCHPTHPKRLIATCCSPPMSYISTGPSNLPHWIVSSRAHCCLEECPPFGVPTPVRCRAPAARRALDYDTLLVCPSLLAPTVEMFPTPIGRMMSSFPVGSTDRRCKELRRAMPSRHYRGVCSVVRDCNYRGCTDISCKCFCLICRLF